MALELECKITGKLPIQKGTSARGEWQKQEFTVEYQEGNYPTTLCLNVWGEDKVKDLATYNEGDIVKISLNLSSREYNGRWYSDIRAWRIERVGGNTPAQATAPATAPTPAPAPAPAGGDEDKDDLPF